MPRKIIGGYSQDEDIREHKGTNPRNFFARDSVRSDDEKAWWQFNSKMLHNFDTGLFSQYIGKSIKKNFVL